MWSTIAPNTGDSKENEKGPGHATNDPNGKKADEEQHREEDAK